MILKQYHSILVNFILLIFKKKIDKSLKKNTSYSWISKKFTGMEKKYLEVALRHWSKYVSDYLI